MLSPTQANSGSNPVTAETTEQPLDSKTEARPAQGEPDAQEGNKSAPLFETETVVTEGERETVRQTAETHVTVTVTPSVENETDVQPLSESSENTAAMKMDSASKQSASTKPETTLSPGCDAQKAKKQNKDVRDGRKYVPSKKAMVDPLKMDMSKPVAIPLTSSQLSLQCIECHIIFSDHKSKERHLKTSHPAEYEQCILRNALFACYVCDRHFTNSIELMAHQKAHTEKKPFKCPICGQAFNKSSELTFHKKVHFGRDGYACTDCGKPCKTLTLLKYHRRTHTGERPYVCKECGKRFTMPKALQKHIASHLPEGTEGDEGDATAKVQLKKNEGKKTARAYSCSVCKATFKSTKTRLHHMKTKHNVQPAAATDAHPAGQPVKESTPIITPISICQPALLQVEPNGPLQKVDANIDTEQIRRLIESLGNVQKVNQVVILGQVPPHAPPLEVQQISQLPEPVNLNLNPPQIDFVGLKQSESKTVELDSSNNPCDSMEQTIILEPITPDGQLENPSFSELGSHMDTGANIELTLVHAEQTEGPEGEMMHQIHEISAVQCDPVEQMVCQNEVADLKENLEQTVILELTPALIPTVELEQSQAVPQNEIPSSSLVSATELGKTPDQTVVDEQEIRLSAPPLMPAADLELTPLSTKNPEPPCCPFVTTHTLTKTPSESETDGKDEMDSQMQTVRLDRSGPMLYGDTPQETRDRAEQKQSNILLVDSKEGREQADNLADADNTTTKEELPSQLDTKQVPQISDLPVNVMSAQELVKVRKRKPARTFIFQGYMQELAGSIYKDDLQIEVKPSKRQRTKKSRLVVKFGPQSKEKKNKKQKKASQQMTSSLPEKQAVSQKKGKKEKRGKKSAHLVLTEEIKSPSLTQDSQIQQVKDDTRKNKMKKQKVAREDVTHVNKHRAVASPIFKKKKPTKIIQKDQPKSPKDGKRNKKLAKEEKVSTKTNVVPADIPGQHIMQDSLLLLKGHKQPQLKVYKLDPSKASAQTQETSPQHESQQSKSNTEPTNITPTGNKKKGGRPPKKNQKALSLLSSLQVSPQPPETLPIKPKTTRKRKAPSNVETEGVITSHSKRALECKDCGERFSEVSSLQKHKAMVHVVESPGLTYTNGNIFEGVSRLDLYQLPQQHDKVGVMSAATDWDTELEMGEMALDDRERTLSFPALIPSPSLPVPPPDVEASAYEVMGGTKTVADDRSHTSPVVRSPSDQFKNSESPPDFTPESALSTSTQTKNSETGEPLASEEAKAEEGTPKHLSSESEVQATTDEDIKEDLLLEVDLITVGEQSEREDLPSPQESTLRNESKVTCNSEGKSETLVASGQANEIPSEKSLTSQTVSCSTHHLEVKEEEEEEMLVRRKKEGQAASTGNATRGRRRGARLKSCMILKRVSGGDTVSGAGSENGQDECQIVYEKHTINSDSEIHDEDKPGTKPETDEFPEEHVVFELQSVTTSVEEVLNERGLQGGEEHDRETDKSPGIILEKFLTSRKRATTDKELCLMTLDNDQRQVRYQHFGKSHYSFFACKLKKCTYQHHMWCMQPFLGFIFPEVNESCFWTVFSVMETGETSRDCSVTPEFNTNQCIFYPVKEEEREVLLGPAQTSRGSSTPEGSSDAHQTEHQTTDSTPRECLLFSYFPINPESIGKPVLPTSVNQLQDENRTREPIDYFSKYFSWDTWVEIVQCTNELSSVPKTVTAREVAQFVGIHIAMGTLKFPSPRLYWEDMTKVPLIAEAMPLSRFLELAYVLKLASPAKDPNNMNAEEGLANVQESKTVQSRHSVISQCSDGQTQRDVQNDLSSSEAETDPLWKVQPLLCRFKAACQSLRREGDYAVDQYPLPLTGRIHNDKLSLHCTTLIGHGGLLLHVDLNLDHSGKEDAVEKMVPKGSMVFLCKQELSTPAMLERLLAAGIHGAGRVGGARGQIGDEFVSSDGKLMLRRSNCGFILSTAGNGQRNMASLSDSFEKAQMSARLNRDLKDLYSIPLTASAPTSWPQAVLWYLTDLALVNSWLLYRQDHGAASAPLTLMAFRLEVSKALILSSSSDTQDSVPPQPPTETAQSTNEAPNHRLVEDSPLPGAATRYDGLGHWPEQLGEGEGGRCRYGDCQRTSRVLCLKCCVFLCISRNHNCFMNFHNQSSSGKE
uniref:Uncharacterized LOC113122645 n=1 Tax=Mastacembelus armatus TaxID=205130 RepID=A0A3Q3NMR3_9TELE